MGEVKGIGIDITDIAKFREIVSAKAGKHFIAKTFTKNEIEHARKNIGKLAATFAAKEAAYKAFGTGWLEGKDVEVLHSSEGVPSIMLRGEIQKIAKRRRIGRLFVSLSYTDCCAAAVVAIAR